jgi:hypothetical protein
MEGIIVLLEYIYSDLSFYIFLSQYFLTIFSILHSRKKKMEYSINDNLHFLSASRER